MKASFEGRWAQSTVIRRDTYNTFGRDLTLYSQLPVLTFQKGTMTISTSQRLPSTYLLSFFLPEVDVAFLNLQRGKG